jgi:hypothetical protein
LSNSDDDLVNTLLQPDQFDNIGKNAPIRGLVGLKIIDYKTEEQIGERRFADILLTVIRDSQERGLVVEVENDRKFDVGEILRKIKKNKRYPVMVIIPNKFKEYSWRFHNSDIAVAYWKANFKWVCRWCNKITKSNSTITPLKCSNVECGKGSNYLDYVGIENPQFERDDKNKEYNFKDLQVLKGKVKYR